MVKKRLETGRARKETRERQARAGKEKRRHIKKTHQKYPDFHEKIVAVITIS